MTDPPRWRRLPSVPATNLRRDVDDELRFHVDMMTQQLVDAGVPESAARAQAERRFGAISPIRDACLTIDLRRRRRLTFTELLAMIGGDIRIALRAVRRTPAFSAAVVSTLAIGIGSAAAIFTVVNAVLLRPLPFRHPEQLVVITHDLPTLSTHDAGITPGMFLTYRRFAHAFTDVAAYQARTANVVNSAGDAQPERVSVGIVTGNLFALLGAEPEIGRTFSAAEDAPKGPNVMLISDGFWKSHFGADPRAVGKALVIFGNRTEIVGVMPPDFRIPDAGTQLWLPRQLDPNAPFLGGFNSTSIARLRPGVDAAAAARELPALLTRSAELYPTVAPGLAAKLVLDQARPVPRVVPLRDSIVGDAADILWVVAAAAALVLLVTATNVANLLLVRADARQRELSVRAALGAGSARVVSHLVTECLVFAGLAGVIGMVFAWTAVRLVVRASPAHLPRIGEVHVEPSTAVFTFLVSLLVALACSVAPGLRFVRANAASALREGGRGGTVGAGRQRTRSALVAAQVAFALVALIASGLLFRSFQRVRAVEPGFNASGVATLQVGVPVTRYPKDADVVHFFARLTERVSQLPGVTSAGMTSRLPLSGQTGDWDPLIVEGTWDASKAIPPLQMYAAADAGYFRTMQIPLIAGRSFTNVEAEHGDVAVVSRETAREMFGDTTGARTVGRRFQILPNGPLYTVVGVIGSARDTSLFHGPTRSVYMPESVTGDSVEGQLSRTMAIVARTTGDVSATARAMRQAVHDLDPTLPAFDVRPMSAVVDASMARLTFTIIILGAAAVVTLVLGLLGLYGVIAYIVTLRTREIGVRIALGATPSAVSAMVTRQGLLLGAAGAAAGLVLAAAMARFLRAFLFEVAPFDPVTISAAVVAVLACASLASWAPARRAARVDPAVTLRAE